MKYSSTMKYLQFVHRLADICKLPSRRYSVNSSQHVYDNITPFETNKELADYLCDNVLYNKNGLIVFNKPYGIAFSRDEPQWKRQNITNSKNLIKHKVIESPDYSPNIRTEPDKVNLFDALPHIKSKLECETLTVIKSPEKYTSGVCILGRSEEIRTKVNTCWKRSKAQKFPIESYLAICSGVPLKKNIHNLRIGITIDTSETGHGRKAVLTKDYSQNSVLQSKVKVATVDSSLESTNVDETASLIRLSSSVKKWHFVRLFLASHLLSPAIGDHQFSSRVKSVLGTNVLVDHWNDGTPRPQKLSKELLELLDLRSGSEEYIPVMIHLFEVNLVGYPTKNQRLTLTAPAPLHFDWTVKKLGLEMPIRELGLAKKLLPAVI